MMPVLNFGTVLGRCESESELDRVAIARSLGPVRARCESTTSLSLVGRIRSTNALIAEAVCSMSVDLKRVLRLGPVQSICRSEGKVEFFLSAIPTAPPVGSLLLSSIDTLVNPQFSARGFNGYRFVRGDLIPIQFKVRGQKLAGLNATFTACRKDEPIGSPHDIVKAPGTINQTDPVRQSNGVEIMTGEFSLNPNDTASLPDGDIDFVYEFKLTDGLGRIHTLEHGRFRVYSVC